MRLITHHPLARCSAFFHNPDPHDPPHPTAAASASPPLRGRRGTAPTLGAGGLALVFALLTTNALAEPAYPARLHVGDHVVMTHDWDYDTNRWHPADPAVNTACFRVLAIDGASSRLELVSGRYFTWWDETDQQPGYQSSWHGTTSLYMEKRPDAAPRELAQGQFTTVAGCAMS